MFPIRILWVETFAKFLTISSSRVTICVSYERRSSVDKVAGEEDGNDETFAAVPVEPHKFSQVLLLEVVRLYLRRVCGTPESVLNDEYDSLVAYLQGRLY